MAGGWAVWRHGYRGRVTQDVDIVVPAGLVDALILAPPAWAVSRFRREAWGCGPACAIRSRTSAWTCCPGGNTRQFIKAGPHDDPASVPLGRPARRYIDLPGLVELKLAAGRVRDESDVVELILANPDQIDAIRQRPAQPTLNVARFDELLTRCGEQTTR